MNRVRLVSMPCFDNNFSLFFLILTEKIFCTNERGNKKMDASHRLEAAKNIESFLTQ